MTKKLSEKQISQFNFMRRTLEKISKDYLTADQIIRQSEKLYGLDGAESLAMSYENIQTAAKRALKVTRYIKIPIIKQSQP